MKSLVVVESPTKAKTIRKYLSKDYQVDSSMGHVRDLPASAKQIPKKYKKEKWSNLGINVDEDFEPLYIIPPSKKKVVKKLKKELKNVDELILATDEDREGEGISWHLIEVLKPTIPVKRMVFHEITQEAIQKALENFRDIDMNLVHAQETRRKLDRLAGYTISPLLWKKIKPGLSAGRVQSVSVMYLVSRERERMKFRSATYYDLAALLKHDKTADNFSATMTHLNDKRLASGKDFDENTGKLKKPDSVVLLDDDKASALRDTLEVAKWKVTNVKKNSKKRYPSAPFITSTLQQEANRKFGFSARDTMRIAQKLYENGYITYMRTDSITLSGQAIQAARISVEENYGKEYLYKSVRAFKSKSKGAQEAHEAIRPAGSTFRKPEETGLSGRDFKLYDLIWKRTVATQMAEAKLEFTNVTITASDGETEASFRASGKKILFPGFFRAYVEGSDNPDEALENQEEYLPEMQMDDLINLKELEANAHETRPPARYTEATLVKELEKQGVGRPSTYANIISTIQDRGYVEKDGNSLVPTFTAFAVTELLENHFPELVDSEFTSQLEDRLDKIAQGLEDPVAYLSSYYKGENGLKEKVDKRQDNIDPREAKKLDLPIELDGVDVLVGRFGPYAQKRMNGDDEAITSSIPVDMTPSEITIEKLEELLKASVEGPTPIGIDPDTDKPVYLLSGRYGPYVQLGEQEEKKKPKRVSLLKGMKPSNVDLDLALKLLSLPRDLGKHPDTDKVVKAGVGRYGPYVVHDGTFASLTKSDNVLEVDLNRAVELLKKKKKRPKKSSAIKDLGDHPKDGKQIKVMNGRYGPYLKYGRKNVSLSNDVDPEKVTMDQALEAIKEKAKKK